MLAGVDPPTDSGIERTRRSKAELAKALDESFAYCDKQYAAMTDSAGAPLVRFGAGGEGSRAFEHYGNMVTYVRLKGVVPPSSEPPFGTYKPPK
jgi:hypothetical protein